MSKNAKEMKDTEKKENSENLNTKGGSSAKAEATKSKGGCSDEKSSDSLALQLQKSLEAISEMEKRYREMEDSMKRIAADRENALRIAKNDMVEVKKYSTLEFAKSLIPLCDNLENARKSAVEGVKISDICTGLDMNIQMFIETMGKHGVKRIDAIGVAFNPSLHQAVSEIEDENAAPGTIVNVLLPGYEMHGRVIRAAMVTVAAKGNKKEEPKQ